MEESRAFAPAAPPERPKVLGSVKQPALFMANVPMDTTQNDVYNHFTKQKDIKINRVEMSISGNPSLGIDKQKLNAVIHFYDHDEADRVLQYYKIQKFRDRQYCLTWYEPQGNKERREWNLFVDGLPPSWRSEELIEEFSPFGSIVSCKVQDEKDSRASKGFGWIQFEEQKSAQAVIQALNDNFVKEQTTGQQYKLSVAYQTSHKSCNVYVSNIPSSLFTESSLAQLFSSFGKVNSVSLIHKIPPSAFVNFETVEAAQKAIQEGKNLQLPEDQRGPLYVSPQYTKKQLARHQQTQSIRGGEENKGGSNNQYFAKNYNDSNLFVRPIPTEVGETELKDLFSNHGDVQSVLIRSIRSDPTNRKGFVLMKSSSQAFNAIKALDGKAMWNTILTVKLYENPAQRRKQFQRDNQSTDMQNPFAMMYTFMQFLMYNQGAQRQQFRHNYGGGSGYPYQNTYQEQLPGAEGFGYQRGRGRGGYNRGQQRGAPRDMRGNMGGGRGRRGGHAGFHGGAPLPGPPAQTIHHTQPPPQPAPLPQTFVQPAVAAEVGTEQSLTNQLDSMGPDERRQFIGNRLFPEVQKKMPLNAGKITGMLVDLSTEQVVQLIMNQDQLNSIIDQAYQQLKTSGMLVAEETPQ